MRTRPKGFRLRPPRMVTLPEISASAAAARIGVTVEQLEEMARRWFLEPTYSVDEVADHFGQGKWQIQELVKLARIHGQSLHPTRGGLFGTFKPSYKARRIPRSAIERHKRHMARVHDGDAAA